MDKRTKILYIVSTLKKSGPTNQLLNIIKHLNKEKFNPSILTLSPEQRDTLINEFKNEGINVDSLNLSRIKGVIFGTKQVREYVEIKKPDIIQTQGIRSDYISATKLSQFKRVTTIRNYPYKDYKMTYGTILGSLMAWAHIKLLKQIDMTVACSESVSKYLRTFRLNSTPIQNGVNNEKYKPVSTEEKYNIRKKVNIPLDLDVFVSVGHLSERKNPILLIKAFINSDAFDNSLLIFVGDGPLRSKCEELSKGIDNIRFVGRVNNVEDYLMCADYFISTSLAEGLPNSVLEALSVGLPSCLSDIDPHREIIKINKNAGVLFKLNNQADLISKVKMLRTGDKQSKKNAAIDIINSELSGEQMSRKYQKLYQSIK